MSRKSSLLLFPLLLCSLLVIGCNIQDTDEHYIARLSNNKDSFKTLANQIIEITDSLHTHSSNLIRKGPANKKRIHFYLNEIELLNEVNRDFVRFQEIQNIYHLSDSSVRILPVTSIELHPKHQIFKKHKYFEYFVCGEPTLVVSTLDSARYYEKDYDRGEIHRFLGDGWYLAYRWDNTPY